MKQVTIYIKPTCPFCKKALMVLKREGVKPNIIDITNNNNLRSQMVCESNRTTVPQIFVEGKHIGDCNEIIIGFSATLVGTLL